MTRTDDVAGIVIRGSAGVGKSRLAREALGAAESGGWQTHWIVGTSAARNLPLGALTAWLEPSVTDTLRLVRGVIDELTSHPAGVSLATNVIGVDDVHLLDELSTFVLHQIAERRTAKLVLTIRDGDPVATATHELLKVDGLAQLVLAPLTHEDTVTLLKQTLGGALDPALCDAMWNLTRGNVLYLRNIVEHEIAEGRLRQERGRWRWGGAAVLPLGLVEMVESRVGDLPGTVSDVIDTLAVGEPIELAALQRISDALAIEDADRRGLITLSTIDDKVEVRLAHPIYGEARRRHAPATTLRRLRGLVVTELSKTEAPDDVGTLVRCAVLSLESNLDPDPDLLLKAARGALRLADLPLAGRLADAAIGAGAGADANFVLAHVYSFLSRADDAVAVLAACPQDQLSDHEKARLAFLRSHAMLFSRQGPAEAKRLVDDAAAATPPHARACIDAFLALYWAVMGEPVLAIDVADRFELLELPAVIGSGTAMALSVAYGDMGRTEDAIATAKIGMAITEGEFDAAQMRFIVADGHIGALLQSGLVAEARHLADELHRSASDLPGAAKLFTAGQSGMVALAEGHLSTAHSLLEPVVDAHLSGGDATGWGYRYQLPYTVTLAKLGRVAEACSALSTLSEHRHPTWRYLDWEYELACGWVAAAEGATSKAITTFLEAAHTAGTKHQLAPEVICLQSAVQLGDRTCAERLHELKGLVEGPRATAAARLASAVQVKDGDELAASSSDFEDLGDLVAATDAAAHAAAAYRRQGRRGSGHSWAQRALSLASECGGAITPALMASAQPLPFTEREREIIALTGEGKTSREIAQILSLSIRTIEGHLYRAMHKVGVHTREELAQVLNPRAHPR